MTHTTEPLVLGDHLVQPGRALPSGIAQIFSYVEQPDKLLSPIECDYREH